MKASRIGAAATMAAAALLSGCAAPGMYQWGSYDQLLYQSYKNPEKTLELRQALEVHVLKLQAANQKVAPGLFAEIGTLYFQSGDTGKAVVFYTKERNEWPESKGLMDALIKNSDKGRPPTPTAPAAALAPEVKS